jgi:hypothetical protein
MRLRALTSLVAVAVVGGAIAGPTLAGGRNDVYEGPIEQSPAPGFPTEETIELYVHTQHHRDGTVTVKIPVVNLFDIHLDCQNGGHVSAGFNAHGVTTKLDILEVAVNHGAFKASGLWEGIDRFKLLGALPRHGPAKGTVEVSADIGVVEGELPGEQKDFGKCASGVLRWSAQRR